MVDEILEGKKDKLRTAVGCFQAHIRSRVPEWGMSNAELAVVDGEFRPPSSDAGVAECQECLAKAVAWLDRIKDPKCHVDQLELDIAERLLRRVKRRVKDVLKHLPKRKLEAGPTCDENEMGLALDA